MGWLYQHHPIDDPVAYLTAQFSHEGAQRTSRVLAAARVGGTVYMAIRSTENATGESYVFAAVILISNTRKHGFGYKEMDEGMGPSECACPRRIMRLLSPITAMPNPGYAADWRARVAAHHQAAADWRTRRAGLRPGCLVTLEQPVSFRDGTIAGVFRLCFMQRRTPIFEPLDRPGFLCRLSGRSLAAAVITPPGALAQGVPVEA